MLCYILFTFLRVIGAHTTLLGARSADPCRRACFDKKSDGRTERETS